MNLRTVITGLGLIAGMGDVTAQNKMDTVSNFDVSVNVPKRFYVGNGLDFTILSTSITKQPGKSTYLTVPRLTAIVNIGFTFHYDLGKRFGLMSGIGLRNIGFIDKAGDTTIKRRVYALGIPVGIKFGNLQNRDFVFLGAGIDLPFNYKEKTFVRRSNKHKSNEWFGEQTPRVLPFIFLGHSWDPGITLKFQYYPGNFLNENYSEAVSGSSFNWEPYNGYKVNLLLMSLGIDIHYGQYRIQEREYQELRKKRSQNRLL